LCGGSRRKKEVRRALRRRDDFLQLVDVSVIILKREFGGVWFPFDWIVLMDMRMFLFTSGEK
jgi:hypothetical protein